jgi:pyruvate formate lyase activating enzyme
MKQSNVLGNISSIETMGLVDGPGIRVVIFLQECKLRCLYCHNPETWGCEMKTLMSVDELINKVLRYKTYIEKNGGVTFSGGEPLLQSEFVYECAVKLKEMGFHICIDTSGVGNNYEKLFDIVDLFIVDVKSVDEDEYKYITGLNMSGYNKFIENLNKHDKKVWLRQVIVPGINDDEKHIKDLVRYSQSIKNVEKIELLPYHTYCESKYKSLNIKYRLSGVSSLSSEKEKELNEILNDTLCSK